jgi:Tfp pilus assembly protein PilO
MIRTKLKPDKRTVALLGAALVGLVAGGGALLYHQQRTLTAVVARLREKEQQRDECARLASRLAETELRYKEDQAHLQFLEASLPDMAYVPTLLKQIEHLGKSTKNRVRGVRPEAAPAKPVRPAVRRTDPEAQEDGNEKKAEDAPKPEPYTRLPIAVSLTGGFQDYQNFLQQLTKFPKIVAVDRVQLRPRLDLATPNGSPQLEVDMQLTAFILKETGAAAPPAGTAAAIPTPPGAAAAVPSPPGRQASLPQMEASGVSHQARARQPQAQVTGGHPVGLTSRTSRLNPGA